MHGKAMSNAQRSSLNRQKAKDELQVAQDNADRLRSEADTLRANIGMLQARQDQQELINQARLQYDLAQSKPDRFGRQVPADFARSRSSLL